MASSELSQILDRFSLVLIDAYGVLVTGSGPLPGANTFIQELERRSLPYYVVTNDASRLPETARDFYGRCGLDIPLDRILTAGMAIEPALKRRDLKNPRCVVLGTADTRKYVERAGGTVVEISDSSTFDAVIIGDDSGFDFLPTMNSVLSSLNRMISEGSQPSFLLANPDLLYPRGNGAVGFTSGSAARLLEIGLAQLHPSVPVRFEVLGKPSAFLFEMAIERAGLSPGQAVMLGDQLHTDIKGANNAGISSVLVAGAITKLPLPADLPPDQRPTFVLERL